MNRWLVRLALAWLMPLSAMAAPQAPPRDLVIGGDLAEIVAALGEAERLIGRDDTSTHPAAIAALPSVGYLRRLAAEGVLSLRPERLLVADQAGPAEVLAQLEASGVTVIRIATPPRLEAIPAKVRAVAEALDRAERGEALASRLEAEIRELAALPALPPLRAMFLLGHGGATPRVAGHETAAQAMMDAVGVTNAFAEMPGYRPVGGEALIRQAPEVVIVTRGGLEAMGGEARLWQLPGLALTPAGQARRLVVFDDQALLGFGPRTPATLLALYERLERLAMGQLPSTEAAP
ncbi:heme/hemin ABC transporter substrate-binding protein [Halomonas sp. 328]|uniref:heme/hemin ABC transporter substrate-binding protein n=1 Tax=Halomonas sp. 328 TaxID=2776704 RepID=UPI0018A78D30|nr:ABC transporter substrate-binding protein [Halomonas sp. 328]MBF8222164.1 ABC transporter substrate-binding protein [Halomonas sp. 328]